MAPKRGVKRSAGEAAIDTSEKATRTGIRQTRLTYFLSLASPPSSPTLSEEMRATEALLEAVESRPARAKKAKAKAPSRATRAPASENKKGSAEKVYGDALKAVDKTFNQLVKKYKPNPTIFSGVTADDFAKAMMRDHIKDVEKLLREENNVALAFDLLLDIGEHAYGHLEACSKASGWGDTGEPYKAMDKLLAEIITARRREGEEEKDDQEKQNPAITSTPKSAFEVGPSRDLGREAECLRKEFHPKRGPNAQQRRQLDRSRLADLRTLFETRRQRRRQRHGAENPGTSTDTGKSTTGKADWAGQALNELIDTRVRIGAYGIGDHYFAESTALLASVKGVETSLVFSDWRPHQQELGLAPKGPL